MLHAGSKFWILNVFTSFIASRRVIKIFSSFSGPNLAMQSTPRCQSVMISLKPKLFPPNSNRSHFNLLWKEFMRETQRSEKNFTLKNFIIAYRVEPNDWPQLFHRVYWARKRSATKFESTRLGNFVKHDKIFSLSLSLAFINTLLIWQGKMFSAFYHRMKLNYRLGTLSSLVENLTKAKQRPGRKMKIV